MKRNHILKAILQSIRQSLHDYKSAMPLFVLTVCVVCALAGCSSGSNRARTALHNYVPESGYVPDAITAKKIAEAVWLPIYGESIYDKRPFEADLAGGVWIVSGTLPEDSLGGTPYMEIQKSDGRILTVSHSK